MKNIIFLLSIILLLASLVGCSDDDKKSSSITGIDFSSDVALNSLDSFVMINGTDSELKIMLASKVAVTSSELIINGTTIQTTAWMDFSEMDDVFKFIAAVSEEMLPQTISIEPGAELDISFTINGKSYSYEGKVAHAPNLQVAELDPMEDFTMNWTLAANPNTQVVGLWAESYSWDDEDEGFDLTKEISGDKRSHTFAKSNFSDYVEEGFAWYDYYIEAINYKISGKHIFVLSSDHYRESYDYKQTQESRFNRASNLIRTLTK